MQNIKSNVYISNDKLILQQQINPQMRNREHARQLAQASSCLYYVSCTSFFALGPVDNQIRDDRIWIFFFILDSLETSIGKTEESLFGEKFRPNSMFDSFSPKAHTIKVYFECVLSLQRHTQLTRVKKRGLSTIELGTYNNNT